MPTRQQFGRWMVLERLGQGGQGEVFKVLDTDTVPVEQAAVRLGRACFEVRQGTLDDAARASWASEVKGALATMRAADDPRFMGALKTLVPVAGGGNMEKAVSRFVAELRTYSQTDHPNVLRLRDANEGERWCVTEFIPGGALACKQTEYVGAPLKALTAFRGLVAGVAALHDKGCIHRDIKPENVFVAADGRLVLGDAGIAFYFDADTPRLTETLENVGSRDWMAPWFMGRRTDVNASADLFSLGKLLWWMCSGLPKLLLWYHREESGNDLTALFPHDPAFVRINRLLDALVVQHERQMGISTAQELLARIDEELVAIRLGAQVLSKDVERRCGVCGVGKYLSARAEEAGLTNYSGTKAFLCDQCGHVQFFRFGAQPPPAWQGPPRV